MKHHWLVLAVAIAGSLAGRASSQVPGFNLNWVTLDTGGGRSAGITYSIQGTLGQFDAANFLGVTRGVDGGFWSGAYGGRPVLTITRSGGNVIFSWPTVFTGFQLQETSTLLITGTTWTDVAQPPAVVNGEWRITRGAAGPARFYRLYRR